MNFKGKTVPDSFAKLFGPPDFDHLPTSDHKRAKAETKYEQFLKQYEGIVAVSGLYPSAPFVYNRFAYSQREYDQYEMGGFNLVYMKGELWAAFTQAPYFDDDYYKEVPWHYKHGLDALYLPAKVIPVYQGLIIESGMAVNKLHPYASGRENTNRRLIMSGSVQIKGMEYQKALRDAMRS